MYKKYIISKYNPSFYDEHGVYQKEEFTSLPEVLEGKHDPAAYEDFCRVEKQYIRAARYLMMKNNVDRFRIAELEKYPIEEGEYLTVNQQYMSYVDRIEEGRQITSHDLEILMPLLLRGLIWCRIYAVQDHFILTADDELYMRVICEEIDNETIKNIESFGLFIIQQ